ncbi:MarR family winged helix-turn-helix transcriptional regulator [Streptomyces sp. enrichment culture]|uniref:MarR family winged helix-turn-helix transcriptional regulator n=1 Tax=Streptomyces sp. enrichment culture TaxID=1795815 RepID=UPI003F560375
MKAISHAPARLQATPSWLVTQIATHAARLVSQALTSVDARRYDFALLASLDEFGPLSQAELGRRCGIDRSYIVEAVNELAGGGLVVRDVDTADRRRNTITITEAGVRQLKRIEHALAEVQDSLLTPLAPAERKQLTALLQRVLDHRLSNGG